MDAGWADGRPLGLQVGEIGQLRLRSALAQKSALNVGTSRLVGRAVGNDAVRVFLLNPFVDDGTAPVINHLRAKNSILVIPQARTRDDASSLGEEDGNGEVLGVLLKLIVSRPDIGTGVAPRIRVEGKEVDNLGRVAATGEIVLKRRAELQDIGRRVADGDLTIALSIAVGLHVAGGSLEIGGGGRIIFSSNVLISNEESQDVVVLLKGIHHRSIALVFVLVPVVVCLHGYS